MANNSTSTHWAEHSVDLSENRGPGLLVVAAVMPSLAFLIVCIRLNVRLFVVHSFGRDDCFILIASVSTSVLCIFNMVIDLSSYSPFSEQDSL